MRPIKYSGKSLETGTRVSGYYCKVEGKYYIILDDAEIEEFKTICLGFNTHQSAIIGFVEVDPETVGYELEVIDEGETNNTRDP